LPEKYGSWHQLYWVDGEVVAFGVLDIVKGGVSSVYFVYNPEGELGGMGWGKVSLFVRLRSVRATPTDILFSSSIDQAECSSRDWSGEGYGAGWSEGNEASLPR